VEKLNVVVPVCYTASRAGNGNVVKNKGQFGVLHQMAFIFYIRHKNTSKKQYYFISWHKNILIS
jgi:hypothetical protein